MNTFTFRIANKRIEDTRIRLTKGSVTIPLDKRLPPDIMPEDRVLLVTGKIVIASIEHPRLTQGSDGVWALEAANADVTPGTSERFTGVQVQQSGWKRVEKAGELRNLEARIEEPREQPEATLLELPLELLDEDPGNPRKSFDEDKLAHLAESIKTHGVLQRILVRPGVRGRYLIVYGHRRVRAAHIACLATIPVEVRELTDADALMIQFLENNQRQDVCPFEEAAALDRLISRHGRDPADLAAELGRSRAYISGRSVLVRLHPDLKALALGDRIPLGAAILLARLPGDLQEQLVLDRLSPAQRMYPDTPRTWTLKEVKQYIRNISTKLADAPWDLEACVGTLTPCSACPKRLGGQLGLFGEGDGDRCGDASCWATKLEITRDTKRGAFMAETGALDVRELREDPSFVARYLKRIDSPCYLIEGTWEQFASHVPLYANIQTREDTTTLTPWLCVYVPDVLEWLEEHDEERFLALSGRAQKQAEKEDRAYKKQRVTKVREYASTQDTWGQEHAWLLARACFVTTTQTTMKKILKRHGIDPKGLGDKERERQFMGVVEQAGWADRFDLVFEVLLDRDFHGPKNLELLETWVSERQGR